MVAQSNPAVSGPPATPYPAPAVRHVFKLRLDVDFNFVVTAIQRDRGPIPLPQKSRGPAPGLNSKAIAVGHAVHTVYEACGFEYTLHGALVAAGAQSIGRCRAGVNKLFASHVLVPQDDFSNTMGEDVCPNAKSDLASISREHVP